MKWSVGDTVRNRPEMAHVYEGTAWFEKMKLPRQGIIIELPWAISNHPEGVGTMLVQWASLTGSNDDPRLWQRWMHSDFVVPV